MKLRDFIEHLRAEPDQDLEVELTKVMSLKRDNTDPLIMTLDFPIIGTAVKSGDLYLVIESALEMKAFGSDIRRFDGTPATKKDVE